MQKTSSPRPVRTSMRRKFVKLGLLIALVGGGGYSAYHLMTTAPESGSAVAHSAESGSEKLNADELKELFASPPPSPSKSATSPTNRYTLTSSKSGSGIDSPVASYSKPKSSTEMPPLGSRYASVNVQPLNAETPEPAKKTPTAEPAVPELAEPAQEVARGQGPDNFNPLRSSVQKADAATAKTASEKNSPPAASSSNEMFSGSKPLPRQPKPQASGGRYPQPVAEATKTSPPAPPVEYGPTPEVASLTSKPAPAYNLNSELPASREPDLAASPMPVTETLGSATPTPGLGNTPGTGRPGERLLEGPQNPSVTIQKLAPEEIQVGRRCTFAIRVQNTGQRTAQGVQINDEIPLGTELVGTAPRASVSGSSVVWDIGTLSVGEERTVEMELIPTEEGELGSVASVTFATQASAKARCTRPELALRLSSKAQVHAGNQHLVQVELTNPGSGEATGIMLLETVPAGVSHEAGPALEFEVGSLGPGESRKLDLVLTAEEAGRVTNTMTARADAGLQVQASCEFEVIAPALQVTVDGPKKRYLERPATYQVSIDNPGTASAKEVQLTTQLPKGLQFVSANNMGEYDASSHSVHWSLAELPANERGTVELVTLPIETGEHTLEVTTKASEGLQDETEAQVRVDGIVALMFEVVDLESPVEIGGETTYEIRVVNQGSKAATNVQVGAIMPQGMRAISGQGESRHAIQGERVVFAPLAQLAPKAESVFRIQAQGLRAGDQRVRVQVVSDEVRQPITKEVSTRVYADQ